MYQVKTKHKNLQVKSISLIFPTAYISSPASMQGHTFLRLDKDINTPLIANAINYSARTNETFGAIFAYKGLFGGYKGLYTMMPYYEKIGEYSDLELRDIWEYRLNFAQKEIDRLSYICLS